MILFVNENNEIKDVNITKDTSLIPLEVNDDDRNPFTNWPVAKICCFKVNVEDGYVTMMTSYIDYRIVEHIEQLGNQNESNSNDIINTQLGLADTFESMESNTEAITQCEEALAEIYEMIIGG